MSDLSSTKQEQNQTQNAGNINVGGEGNQVTVTFTQTQVIQISIDEVKARQFIKASPYKGLKKFEFKDKGYFFGRDEFLQDLVDELEYTNLILILGTSGSGKSSVVRAGIIPYLNDKWGSSSFVDLTFTPDLDPFKSLYASLLLSEYKYTNANDSSDSKYILKQIVKILKPPDVQWLIFIDQFEELFTNSQPEKSKIFIDGLIELIRELNNNKDCSVKIIGTMRADFLDRLSPYPALVKATEKHRPMIAEMQPDGLRLAIEQPAAQHGVVFETGLVEEIIKNVQWQAGYLPLLQYTLNLIWEEEVLSNDIQNNRTIHISTYRNLGGVRGALQKRLEKIYQGLSKPEQEAVQRVFLRLVDIGSNEESGIDWRPVRRRATQSEFKDELEIKTLRDLVNLNLLVTDNTGEQSIVEIAHEALLTSWKTLEELIKENRRSISLRNRLNDDVSQWKTKRSDDDLWNGAKLQEVIELNNDPTFNSILGGFGEKAKEFIKISKEKRERQQRRMIQFLSSGLIVALGLSGMAAYQWQQASYREKIARSIQLSTASSANLEIDTTRSLLLGIQAVIEMETPQATLALWNALQRNHERYQLVGHEGDVLYAEYDPTNSKRILTVSSDRTARIWNLDNIRQPLVLKGHQDTVIRGSFNPKNPNQVLTVSHDGTARVWDLDNPDKSIVLKGHSGLINDGSFDPQNPNRILTVGSDGIAIVWDLRDQKHPIILKGHIGDIWQGSFNPKNSNLILTVGKDTTARIWDLNKLDNPVILKGHTGEVLYGSFDPKDPNRVLTTSNDRTTKIWNLRNLNQTLTLRGHEGTVKEASFDVSNPSRILTVSSDSTARVWDLTKPDNPLVLREHRGEILHGIFNPTNSNQVLTVSTDGTSKLWDLEKPNIAPLTFYGHSNKVTFGTFDPQNPNKILTTSEDRTARIWDISNSNSIKLVVNKCDSDCGFISAAFDRNDKSKLFTISRDGSVRWWNIRESSPNSSLSPIQLGSIKNAFFAPSNPNIIATISNEGEAFIWNLDSPNKPIKILRAESEIKNVSFDTKNINRIMTISSSTATIWSLNNDISLRLSISSSVMSHGNFDPKDPNRVATASDDGAVQIWNLGKTDTPQTQLKSSQKEIWYVSFDPHNYNHILTMGSDKIARILDIDSRKVLLELVGHENIITFGEFDSKKPSRIMTNSYDGTTRIWNLNNLDATLVYKNDSGFIYSSFDSSDSNQVVNIDEKGNALVYAIGITELIQLAWNSTSRCFSKRDAKD